MVPSDFKVGQPGNNLPVFPRERAEIMPRTHNMNYANSIRAITGSNRLIDSSLMRDLEVPGGQNERRKRSRLQLTTVFFGRKNPFFSFRGGSLTRASGRSLREAHSGRSNAGCRVRVSIDDCKSTVRGIGVGSTNIIEKISFLHRKKSIPVIVN